MMDFFRRHMRTIFLITIFGFLAGAFVGFGGYFFADEHGDTVAEVNGHKISYRQYSTLLNRVIENARQSKEEMTGAAMNQKKQEVLQDLIQEEVFSMEAKKYGITVSDQELAADIQSYPAFQRNGQFDRNAYFQILYQMLRTTPREFEESRRHQILISKLRQFIASSVVISEPELQAEYARKNGGKMTDFNKNKQKFADELRQEKVMMVFNEWFKQLNQTVKIKVYLNDFERQS